MRRKPKAEPPPYDKINFFCNICRKMAEQAFVCPRDDCPTEITAFEPSPSPRKQ